VKFWDTSALVALAFPEASSGAANAIAEEDDLMATWWGTPAELESAIQRGGRSGDMTPFSLRRGRTFLDAVEERFAEMAPTAEIRQAARRLVRVHDLRAADALQLAAALAWCAGEPDGQGFVSLDRRLRAAAELEGFRILPEEASGEPPAG
jgi:predicted nucleic acid-binding protein